MSASYWAVWSKNDTAWRGCNTQNPAVAVNDGITHYAMRVGVVLNDSYVFDEETQIYFNGTNITFLGHTRIDEWPWGGYVYIDWSTAGAKKNPYNTVNITANTIVTAVWENKPHTHQYTIQKHNADYHWQECACGDKVSFAEHDMKQTLVKATAYATGYTKHSCKECAYQYRDTYTAPAGKVTGFKCAARTQAAE